MSEREWQSLVLEFARLNKWHHYHTHDSRHSAAGFPDLVLIRPPELLIVELKTERGKLAPAQLGWLLMFAECGIETYEWRPSDEREMRERLSRRGPTAPTACA